MPKTLAFKTPSSAHRVGMGSIWWWLALLWGLGSLWSRMGWICGLRNGIRTRLVKGLVPGKGFGILRFRGLPCFFFVAQPCEQACKPHQK